MHRSVEVFKSVAYLGVRPRSLKLLVRLLHLTPRRWNRGLSTQIIRRILIAQPHNSLGDLVLTFPLLEEIHRIWPEASIDVLVGSKMTDLFTAVPFVSRVIEFTPSTLPSPAARYADSLALLRLCRNELLGPYDLALDPRWDSDRYAYLARAAAFFSEASVRASYSGAVDGVDASLDELMTHLASGGEHEHESIRKTKLLERAGFTSTTLADHLPSESNATLRALATLPSASVESLLRSAGIQPGEPYCVVAPSANDRKRIWPVDRMAEVMRYLSDKYALRTVILGSPGDKLLCDGLTMLAPTRASSLAGRTTVLEMCGILATASLFLGNDSGPAHASGMLGTKTIAISAFPSSADRIDHANSPRRFHPCGPLVRITQPDLPLPPCNPVCVATEAHCITKVSVASVLAICDELLSMAFSVDARREADGRILSA
jgi:ADP-heptose:LPS heptosyltransferase